MLRSDRLRLAELLRVLRLVPAGGRPLPAHSAVRLRPPQQRVVRQGARRLQASTRRPPPPVTCGGLGHAAAGARPLPSGTGNGEARYGTIASSANGQTVAPLFTTNAADRTQCYDLIAFGSQNCCVYCDSFPREDGRYQLTQLFDSNDRLSCEWCDKERGVCKQARDAAGDLASCDLRSGSDPCTNAACPRTCAPTACRVARSPATAARAVDHSDRCLGGQLRRAVLHLQRRRSPDARGRQDVHVRRRRRESAPTRSASPAPTASCRSITVKERDAPSTTARRTPR